MKDFYDIYYLADTFDFTGEKLQTTIQETLQNRQTVHDKKSFTRIMNLKSEPDMKVKWRYFPRTIGDEHLQFEWMIEKIEQILLTVYEAMIKG
jgi:5S rRNA maturation endonuclease (ribonuclease M5)